MNSSAIDQYLQRAISAHQRGDIEAAQPLYHAVLRRDPGHALTLRNLGLIALSTGHYDAAVDLIHRALQLQPEHGQWHGELAQAQRRAGATEAALASFQRAVSMRPADPFHHYLHGELLLDLRRHEQGIQALQQALQLDPHISEAWASLAFLASTGDYHFSAGELQQLQRLLDDAGLSSARRYPLHFAMANLAHAQGEYARAFEHYVAANQLKLTTHQAFERFDPQRQQALLQQHEAMFTADFLAHRTNWGNPSAQPVFIVGLLRTGSTLLERILSSHPHIEGRGELTDIRQIARTRLPRLTGTDYPQCLQLADQSMIAAVGEWYLQRLNRHPASTLRCINKMPFDFQLLGLIHLMFPNAGIIHTVRDPVATLWSCFSRDVHARFSNGFADLIAAYRLYRQYLQLWQRRLPGRIHTVHYEALVDDFHTVVSGTLAQIGLDWHEQCRQFHQTVDKVDTPSRMQVRKPIYHHANAAWQPYAKFLQPLIDGVARIDDEFGPQ